MCKLLMSCRGLINLICKVAYGRVVVLAMGSLYQNKIQQGSTLESLSTIKLIALTSSL